MISLPELTPLAPEVRDADFLIVIDPIQRLNISAMSKNSITFDSPITLSYRVGHEAQVHCWRTPHTRNAGVENLTAQHADNDNIDFNLRLPLG
jgi:hypothetical protein